MYNKSIYRKADGHLAFKVQSTEEPDLSDFPADDFWILDTYEDEFTKYVDGAVQPLSETEKNTLLSEKHFDDFRGERNTLLDQSDWTQMNDSPLSGSVKTQWQTYRQQLRDMPQADGFDPLNPTWPTSP